MVHKYIDIHICIYTYINVQKLLELASLCDPSVFKVMILAARH